MSYLSAFDVKAVSTAPTTAVALQTAPKTYVAPTMLLNNKMTTYAQQVKPTVQQAAVKTSVTATPSPEVQVTVTPQEVEVTTTGPAPSPVQVQSTAAAATEKKNWLPMLLGAGALFWFYKKK